MKELQALGMTYKQIGDKIESSRFSVREVLRGNTWNHITGLPKVISKPSDTETKQQSGIGYMMRNNQTPKQDYRESEG